MSLLTVAKRRSRVVCVSVSESVSLSLYINQSVSLSVSESVSLSLYIRVYY